ncbi:pleckstrin homology domain-containing family B member 1 [Notothenia coriiceps]|uniref:Pleckstrin homology domain-containing family B member 1 n=1 Tax=Notothenia coriiceps TaxID=8208 RepID=A0A6I9N7A9_9TELE|nr:PREDICTED: pleckstrin homology domain-containing family B member 1-like [Notothenia coriiceps]
MALLRSGWLWRQTSVLKRWKLNWCDLWIDGNLCFYKNESRRDLEHRVSLKTRCVDVRSGLECGGVSPPESNPRENLIVVQLSNGSTVNLCANSEDESLSTLTSVPSSKDTRQVMTDFASPAAGMCVTARWASRNRLFSACFRMERRPSVLRRKLSMMGEREGHTTTPVGEEKIIVY